MLLQEEIYVPKIIKDLRDRLLAEAKRQITENGYAATTVRSIARHCGLGVGTVYNYFESKEMLVATFVFEDWKRYLSDIQELPSDSPRELFEGIYNALRSFEGDNEKLFNDSDAMKRISDKADGRHKLLREQIAGFLRDVCNSDFEAKFIAEALICWSVEGEKFDTVYPILEKIMKIT